jgi:hypothetical protein
MNLPKWHSPHVCLLSAVTYFLPLPIFVSRSGDVRAETNASQQCDIDTVLIQPSNLAAQ